MDSEEERWCRLDQEASDQWTATTHLHRRRDSSLRSQRYALGRFDTSTKRATSRGYRSGSLGRPKRPAWKVLDRPRRKTLGGKKAHRNGPGREMPFVLMAIEHDGAGEALQKQSKRAAGSGTQI
jgi:hypothetical protein